MALETHTNTIIDEFYKPKTNTELNSTEKYTIVVLELLCSRI